MSHFVIWDNRIFLFGQYETDFGPPVETEVVTQLDDAVREQLPETGLIPFSEIALKLGAVPWDALAACRRLVQLGLAREGEGDQRGSFGHAS